jgi:hypothetical protein
MLGCVHVPILEQVRQASLIGSHAWVSLNFLHPPFLFLGFFRSGVVRHSVMVLFATVSYLVTNTSPP